MIALAQKNSLSFWLNKGKKIIISREQIRVSLIKYLKDNVSHREKIRGILSKNGFTCLSKADDHTAIEIYNQIRQND